MMVLIVSAEYIDVKDTIKKIYNNNVINVNIILNFCISFNFILNLIYQFHLWSYHSVPVWEQSLLQFHPFQSFHHTS